MRAQDRLLTRTLTAVLPLVIWGVHFFFCYAYAAVACQRGSDPAWVLGAFAGDLRSQFLAGLDPTANAWAATIAAMLSYQGLHAVVLTILAVYLVARSWTGRLSAVNRATLDNCALVWHYATLQGVIIAVVLQVLPKLMEP